MPHGVHSDQSEQAFHVQPEVTQPCINNRGCTGQSSGPPLSAGWTGQSSGPPLSALSPMISAGCAALQLPESSLTPSLRGIYLQLSHSQPKVVSPAALPIPARGVLPAALPLQAWGFCCLQLSHSDPEGFLPAAHPLPADGILHAALLLTSWGVFACSSLTPSLRVFLPAALSLPAGEFLACSSPTPTLKGVCLQLSHSQLEGVLLQLSHSQPGGFCLQLSPPLKCVLRRGSTGKAYRTQGRQISL